MAIPGESSDEEEANVTATVASTDGAAASTVTVGSLATLAAAAAAITAGATTSLTVSAADTEATETAAIAEGQTDVPGATVFHLYATGALHGLDSEEYASGDQQDLASIENGDAGTQQSSGEPRASPVEEASAAVVPTPVTAFPEPNRIRDGASGITARVNNNILPTSSLSPASEDDESSSSEEYAVGGVTKRNSERSVEKNLSNDQLSSVDVFRVTCRICNDRFWDSVCIPCGHLGCHHCIERWLLSSYPPRSCYMCRRKVESVQTPVVLCNRSLEPCFTN